MRPVVNNARPTARPNTSLETDKTVPAFAPGAVWEADGDKLLLDGKSIDENAIYMKSTTLANHGC